MRLKMLFSTLGVGLEHPSEQPQALQGRVLSALRSRDAALVRHAIRSFLIWFQFSFSYSSIQSLPQGKNGMHTKWCGEMDRNASRSHQRIARIHCA
jgi:hypothetical protein